MNFTFCLCSAVLSSLPKIIWELYLIHSLQHKDLEHWCSLFCFFGWVVSHEVWFQVSYRVQESFLVTGLHPWPVACSCGNTFGRNSISAPLSAGISLGRAIFFSGFCFLPFCFIWTIWKWMQVYRPNRERCLPCSDVMYFVEIVTSFPLHISHLLWAQ